MRILRVGRIENEAGGGNGMTASGLKDLYEKNNPQGYFFSPRTMRFFGDRMSNFGVRSAVVKSRGEKGMIEVEVWDLYRKKSVRGISHGHCAYFRKDSGKEVHEYHIESVRG